MEQLDRLAQEFLNLLEEKESKLLSWGCVDGGFSEDEINQIAEDYLIQSSSDLEPYDFIKVMVERGLLFAIEYGSNVWWRTRMAESIRLFARLRQIFPARSWQVSPTLVADFRFCLRPRTYPARDISPEEVMRRLSDLRLGEMRWRAINAIISPAGESPMLLSEFQVLAIRRMFEDLKAKKSKGMIVCAGTGTGKTLSFYLPALSHIACLIERDEYWTKAIAIYPRNELLKDQFSETYREARKLDDILLKSGKRKIIIGAFFGPTAAKSSWIKEKWAESRSRQGYICPYLNCPECGRELMWKRKDIVAGLERLYCSSPGCTGLVSEDEIILTRERMVHEAPDILFTTTEMLNRQMTDNHYEHIFGIGASRKPQIVLLDEVHTYCGVHGAQVAFLLRRWQKKAGIKAHFTGLSATLEDAGDFFSQLVGLSPVDVLEIQPQGGMVTEGREYQLILRGDPVSASSLLSTSIQAAMLLGRILDPRIHAPISQGFYGQRVFAFTDDLDVTNRFFHDLLDAEGLDSWGRRIVAPLAALRSRNMPDNGRRLLEGQSWYICEQIGHSEGLTDPLKIGRTSSQDSGVDDASDVIVATAALEVGYNDPRVGAVLQHKAPLGMASFLQRKGRAGRPRLMRPWTVVVLSDYGRDRLAYQSYERLFNPMLSRINLPLGNRYVQRMQAVYALMDWLSEQEPLRNIKGTLWNDLSGPSEKIYNVLSKRELSRKRQKVVAETLLKLLQDPATIKGLQKYLVEGLKLNNEDIAPLLWDPPRALITHAVPTALRRLESNWQKWEPGASAVKEHFIPYEPLPDFVPSSLFSDLKLPEVMIITPPDRKGDEQARYPMPIVQALNTFAPGKVTRRFGIAHRYVRHWIPVPDEDLLLQHLPVSSICSEYDIIGQVRMWEDGGSISIPCYRPRVMSPTVPSQKIKTTSNSWLEWRSQIVANQEGVTLDVPYSSIWCQLIQGIQLYSHIFNCPVEVRRFSLGALANVKFEGGRELEARVRFSAEDGGAASIGFIHDVDGILFRCKIPDQFKISSDDPNQEKVRSFRTAYFRHRVMSDERLDGIANAFQRDWIYQVYLAAVLARAMIEKKSLSEACQEIFVDDFPAKMDQVLETIFQTIEVDSMSEGEDTSERRQRVHELLRDLFRQDIVTETLHDLCELLWQPPDDSWQKHAKLRFKATLGCALMQACLQIVPQAGSGDLLIDIEPGPSDDVENFPDEVEKIWITEGTAGGGGIIEVIARSYSEDPRRFFRMVESALDPNDFEVVDTELSMLLEMTVSDMDVSDALQTVRSCRTHREMIIAMEKMRKLLFSKGTLLTHPVMSAISTRILRPGTSQYTDILQRQIINKWNQEEERLAIEIDSRVFAYVCSLDDEYLHGLSCIEGGDVSDGHWRFQVFYSLFWPRGLVIRSQSLTTYHPFAKIPEPDRELVRDVIYKNRPGVCLDNANWKEQVCKALSQEGMAHLFTSIGNEGALMSAVIEVATTPIEVGALLLYARIDGYRREGQQVSVTFDLREAIQ